MVCDYWSTLDFSKPQMKQQMDTKGGFVELVDLGKHGILAHCKGPAC